MPALNTTTRKKILTALMARTNFEARLKEVKATLTELGNEVIRKAIPEKHRKLMEQLPENYFEMENQVWVNAGGENIRLPADNWRRPKSYGQQSHWANPVLTLEASDPLCIKIKEAMAAKVEIKDEESSAEAKASATIENCRSTSQLIAAWPEIEPIVRPYHVNSSMLPAVIPQSVNSIFGLPIGTKSDAPSPKAPQKGKKRKA